MYTNTATNHIVSRDDPPHTTLPYHVIIHTYSCARSCARWQERQLDVDVFPFDLATNQFALVCSLSIPGDEQQPLLKVKTQ